MNDTVKTASMEPAGTVTFGLPKTRSGRIPQIHQNQLNARQTINRASAPVHEFSMEYFGFDANGMPGTPDATRADQLTPGPAVFEEFDAAAKSTDLLLPPPSKEDAGKICVVLDLDETLVHSTFMPHPRHEFSISFGTEENAATAFVLVRPGAKQLVRELGPLFELVVFTAGLQQYADPVVNMIDPDHHVKFRLFRPQCTEFGGAYVKDLGRLNRKLERTIIIDNSPSAYLRPPFNAINVESWFDEPDDQVLFAVMDFLKVSYRIRNVYDILTFD
jgi:RNA polymerase II subunit A small phosphatase-like protein